MPTISMFHGIIIRMYYGPKEHNPPHIHSYYQAYEALYDILSAEIIDGNMPATKNKLILGWLVLHKVELLANWELCQNGEIPFKIEGLR
jgi:nitrate reductase beta subunit